jgi:hypothetical protein
VVEHARLSVVAHTMNPREVKVAIERIPAANPVAHPARGWPWPSECLGPASGNRMSMGLLIWMLVLVSWAGGGCVIGEHGSELIGTVDCVGMSVQCPATLCCDACSQFVGKGHAMHCVCNMSFGGVFPWLRWVD